MTNDGERKKPLFRGHSHQAAFFAALGAGIVLIAAAPTPRATVASSIYTVTLVLLFGISALYHRPWWPDKPREVIARIDHAMIFLFIAGSYTPFCMLALSPETGRFVLLTMWTTALLLATSKIVFRRLPRLLMSFSYVAMGWFAAWSLPEAASVIGVGGAALLLLGGLIYTVGAVIFWRKAPNPIPGVFGYHEVFHLLVVAAGLVHFVVIARLVFAG